MTSKARMVLPPEEMPVSTAIARLPGCQYRVEESAFTGRDRTLHLWITCEDSTPIEPALAADSSIETYERLVHRDSDHLFELELSHRLLLPRAIIRCHGGVVSEAYGHENAWILVVRFPDRDSISDVDDEFARHNVEVAYDAIVQTGTPRAGAFAMLTECQREALIAAFEEGFFEVPRQITLAELADQFGVSHQALSERFRRAYETLVKEHLVAETAPVTTGAMEGSAAGEQVSTTFPDSHAH